MALASFSLFAMISASLFVTTTAVTANPASWSPRVTVAQGVFGVSDLYIGQNNEYVLTWDYPAGPVYIMLSEDCGATWTQKDVFGFSIYGAWPAMCGYENGSQDELIIVAADHVAISRNSGDTFERLTDLPMISTFWTSMAVGTKASWFGGQGNEIFVAGTPDDWNSYHVALVKSADGGRTWGAPIYPAGSTGQNTYWPNMVSDGSRICLVYSILNNVGPREQEDFDLHVRYSDDWGATWSDDIMLSDAPTGEHRVSWQMQYVGGHKAILTFMDQIFGPGSTIITAGVSYGYLDTTNLTYTEVGLYSDGGWIGYGVSGVLQEDGRFSVAYVENVPPSGSNLYYTSSYDTGLTGEFNPPAPRVELSASIDVKPDTLNPKRMGNYLTSYIELPEGCDVRDILIDSVVMNGQFPTTGYYEIDDFDKDQISELMVKFERQKVFPTEDSLAGKSEITMTVAGELVNGTFFEGSDTVRVAPSKNSVVSAVALTSAAGIGAMFAVAIYAGVIHLGNTRSHKRSSEKKTMTNR